MSSAEKGGRQVRCGRVEVRLKRGVMDAQGQAVRRALHDLGFAGVADVRIGRLVEVVFAPGTDAEQARQWLQQMGSSLLAHPAIEEFRTCLEEQEQEQEPSTGSGAGR
ncbi:MAG: phosphoribosylformylglycinamidine synthase subunit PurS [Deltaproteobacteria bacterium]|nr:phosphoribosylformylglycinamidine synthase subunit PurS [Deltaproteobacteria bacterium]